MFRNLFWFLGGFLVAFYWQTVRSWLVTSLNWAIGLLGKAKEKLP